MNTFISRLIPFILLGMGLVALFFGLVLMAYLLAFGAILGIVLFVIAWVKEKFFPSKVMVSKESVHRQGHTFDNEK